MESLEGFNIENTIDGTGTAAAASNRRASHLVLSKAPLQSGGDATTCASLNSTTLMLPTDTDCVGGIASVFAGIRNLPQGEETLFIPWLDRESVFVQMHPARLAVNRMVMLDYYQSRTFISTHSLLTLEDDDKKSDSDENAENASDEENDDTTTTPTATSDTSGLRTHDMPFLMTNTLVPPSNPWKEYTSMVHFDDETLLAVIYVENEVKTLGAPMTESTIGALNYISTTNEANGCNDADDLEGPCYVPVVLLSVRDAETYDSFLDAMISSHSPPAVLISNQYDSSDENWLVPQKVEDTWVVQFPFRNDGLSHSFRIETKTTTQVRCLKCVNNVVTNVTSTATDLEALPLTLEGDALSQYQSDQTFLKGLAEVAIQNDPVVGQSGFMPITREGNLRRCMGGECPIGNLWTDAIRWGAGNVDIAFAPSGGLRGPGWPEGDVRVSDLYRGMPFANTLCTGTMSGISLFNMLNYSTSVATFEGTYTPDGDRLLQISGARYSYNTNLNTTRLLSIDVWDRDVEEYRPVERLKMYTFAAENFLCDIFQPFATFLGAGLEIEGEEPAVNDDSRYIQEIVSDYLTTFHSVEPYDTSVQGRLVNNTEATETMNLVQTKESCTRGTYWQEHIQTCSICPDHRQVTFSEPLVALEAPQGTLSQQAGVVAINSDVEDVRIVLSSLPPWVDLSFPSTNDSFGRGRPIDISSGEQIGLQLTASAENMDIGNTLGSVQFSVVDSNYPGCFRDQDLSFDVQVRVLPQDERNLLGAVRYGGFALMAIVMITTLAFATWTYCNRKVRVVRASQPIFLGLLCAGAIIMSSAIVPLSIDDSVTSLSGCNVACMAAPWLGSIGFTVVFSALFSKLHRVHKVLRSAEKFRKVTITEKDVAKPFLALLTLNVLFLLVWTVMDPMRWIRLPMSADNPWSTYGVCRSEGSVSIVFGTLTLLVDTGALLMACVWAYQTRNIATEYAESKFIGIAIFGIFQVIIVGLPLVFLVNGNPKALYFLLSAIIFTICMSVLLLMFVPKLQQQVKQNSGKAGFQRWQKLLRFRNQTSSDSMDSMSDPRMTTKSTSSIIDYDSRRASTTASSRTTGTVGLRILSRPEKSMLLEQELNEYKEKVALLELRLKEANDSRRTMSNVTDDEEEGRVITIPLGDKIPDRNQRISVVTFAGPDIREDISEDE